MSETINRRCVLRAARISIGHHLAAAARVVVIPDRRYQSRAVTINNDGSWVMRGSRGSVVLASVWGDVPGCSVRFGGSG